MNKKLLLVIALLSLANYTYAFTCTNTTGQTLSSLGDSEVTKYGEIRVNVQPTLNQRDQLVIDLSSIISCKNDDPGDSADKIRIQDGAFLGPLQRFNSVLDGENRLQFYDDIDRFPLDGLLVRQHILPSGSEEPLYAKIIFIPKPVTNGLLVKNGDPIAYIVLKRMAGDRREVNFRWTIIAANDVTMPTKSCDVSTKSVIVTLPDYPPVTTPGTPSGNPKSIDLTIHCTTDQKLIYKISGTTVAGNKTIFANTASAPAAQGIGIQFYYRGTIIPVDTPISLGVVGTDAVKLELTTNYELTGEEVTAGLVQAIVYVKFDYQ